MISYENLWRTMQEKGVSTVIELDLESAQKTIEE